MYNTFMANKQFEPSNFFDLSGFAHADLFDGRQHVWEVLPKLKTYIAAQLGGEKSIVGEDTVVEEGAFIKGPAIVGKNCYIGHGAYIREHVIIGDNVHIGHGVEVKNSIIIGNTAVAHLNYIGDSIVGSNINIGGGAKTANFRLDGQTIRIKIGEEYVDTGLEKFGAVIGDSSKIGVNAVLNPGTILGKDVSVYPLVSVFGVHRDGEVIK